METRVLIPKGLRLKVVDEGSKIDGGIDKLLKGNAEEENEEKPSSSSGHCETVEDSAVLHKLPKGRSKGKGSSSCSDDPGKFLKKKSFSQSSLSLTSGSESSSASENEAEMAYLESGKSENAKEESSEMQEEEKEKPLHKHVKICVTSVIEKGTIFTPNDGHVQVVHLKGIPAIPKDDIRFVFGCFEKIAPFPSPSSPSSSSSDPLVSPASTTATSPPSPLLPEENSSKLDDSASTLVRLCNWVRFLRGTNNANSFLNKSSTSPPPNFSSESEDDHYNIMEISKKRSSSTTFHTKKSISPDCPNLHHDSSKISFSTGGESSNNIIARISDGRPIFQVTERLVPGTELIAHFDMNSVLNYAALHAQPPSSYVTKTQAQVATPPVVANISATAALSPAPYSSLSSSTRISSSSPVSFNSAGSTTRKTNVGHGASSVNKDRDEKEPLLLQQSHQRQLAAPVFPYPFHSFYNNASLSLPQNTGTQNGGDTLPFWQNNGLLQYDAYFGKKGKGDEKRKLAVPKLSEGPLDLSKFPDFKRSRLDEPLKIGTPFDSPDSNDDDLVKGISSPDATSESGRSPLFSIRNVLKHHSSSGGQSKLFQPYSLEVGQKCGDREALLKALTSQSNSSSSSMGLLVTTPSSAETQMGIRTPSGLRPILRTRGRERSLLPCEVCGKAFDRPSLLKRHLRTHTGEKPHVCDVCSKGFSTSSSLNTHRRIHSGEKPHQCPICGKRFTASSNLYYHRMTHNKEKPHKCMLCGKSFPTPGDLKSHQYVHSGSWPYTCPVCHRGFSKQTNLRNHLLLHSGVAGSPTGNKSGDKPHTCQICDKKFAQACNLRAHIKTHEESDSSSLICPLCKRPSADLLQNGHCRDCTYPTKRIDTFANKQYQRESTSSSPMTPSLNTTASTEKSKETLTSSPFDVSSLLSHRMASSLVGNSSQPPHSIPLAPSVGHFGVPLSNFSGALAGIPGLSNALSFPSTSTNLNFPLTSNHHHTPSSSDLFNNPGTAPPPRNALLEQLVEWNYRMAKESVGIGSLGFSLMQQKLLESRMLAAQLMNTHGFGINGGIQDLLGLRSVISSKGYSALDASNIAGDNEFMQR